MALRAGRPYLIERVAEHLQFLLFLLLFFRLLLGLLRLWLGLRVGRDLRLLERGILRNTEPEAHEHLQAGGEVRRVGGGEPGAHESHIEEGLGDIGGLGILVVALDAGLKLANDRVGRVDLQGLLGHHGVGAVLVAHGLGLHDTLHVGGPTVLGGHNDGWGLEEAVGDNSLLDLGAESLLEPVGELLVSLGELLVLGLLLGIIVELEVLLVGAHELEALELGKLRHGVLIDRVDVVEDLNALLAETLEVWRFLGGFLVLSGNVIDVFLALGHARDILLEGGEVVTRLGGLETEELRELGAVGGVLVEAEFDGLVELLPEVDVLLVVLGGLGRVGSLLLLAFLLLLLLLVALLLLLRHLADHLEGLGDKLLLDDTENLGGLEHLAGDIQWKVLGIDDTLNEGQPPWHEVFELISDEDTTDIELDVGRLGLALEEVIWGLLWDEEDRLELDLTFSGEVHLGERLLGILGNGGVETVVLVLLDVTRGAGPDGGLGVDLGPLDNLLVHLLGLRLGGLVTVLDLELILLLLVLLLLSFLGLLLWLLLDWDLLLDGLGLLEVNWEGNELRVLLHELLDLVALGELLAVVLEVESDGGTAAEGITLRVLLNGERRVGGGLPDVLLVVVVLGADGDLVGDEVDGVETDTELTDEVDVATLLELLEEGGGTGLGNGSQIVDEVLLGHTDTPVGESKGILGLVWRDPHFELGGVALTEGILVGDGQEANLV